MKKICSHLWFDSQAQDAASFYTSLFRNSKIGTMTRYGKAGVEIHGQPEGKVMTVEFELDGQPFIGLNAGPLFTFTPAISFLIACSAREEVETLWTKLSAGGMALMELGAYPFSERYGWTQDQYGLSWQVMFVGDGPVKQKITPTLMFVGDVCGKAEEAINFYASIFHNAQVGNIIRYGQGEGPDKEGTIKHAAFTLEGQQFAAMDSAREHPFTFNEAISFMVQCETQNDIDHYWDKLAKGGDPKAQQCGWLRDRFGVSWQVTPTVLGTMLQDPDKTKVERVTNAFLKMKKFDLAALRRAYEELVPAR
jgi:predicted 3-demethylubiquinone-9 3-methyltransferase (glyoxalase superfamily)